MTLYTVTRNSITDGKLDYCITDAVFTDKEAAKAFAKKQVVEQANTWNVAPRTFRKVKGYYYGIELKHPTQDTVITVILEAKELTKQ